MRQLGGKTNTSGTSRIHTFLPWVLPCRWTARPETNEAGSHELSIRFSGSSFSMMNGISRKSVEQQKSRYGELDRKPATTGLSLCDCSAFLQRMDSAPNGTRPWLFGNEAPQPHEIRPDEDPEEVIRRCRIMNGNPQLATDIVNNAVTSLARSIQRVILSGEIMLDAIALAKQQLLHESQRARGLSTVS